MTKKHRWILISVLSGVALFVAVSVGGLDVLATSAIDRRLQASLKANDKFTITYNHLAVMLVSRTVELYGVTFSTARKDTIGEAPTPIDVHVKHVSLRQFGLLRLLKERHLYVDKVVIDHPDIALNLPMVNLADSTPMKMPLKGVDVEQVTVKNGSLRLSNSDSNMRLSLGGVNLAVRDICYDIPDASLSYNDSVYHLSLADLDFTTADGLFRVCLKSLDTKDAGALTAEQLHCFHTVNKSSLAEKKGKIPVTWADVTINNIITSPVNLIRQALAKEIALDQVTVAGRKLHIFRDIRYPAKEPYALPQDLLLAMDVPMHIQTVQMSMPQIEIEMCTQDIAKGSLSVKNVNGTIKNVTNRRGEKMQAKAHAELASGGTGDISFNMQVDKAGHFDFAADCKRVSGENFNQFLHPLFGLEASIVVDRLTTRYSGDRRHASGTFCMTYDDIQVHVFKEDTPYQLIAKNAGAINAFAPVVLQRRNPRIIGQQPQSYEVTATRNVMKNYGVYLMGPLLDGVLKTMLPGYLVKSIDKKTSGANKDKKK